MVPQHNHRGSNSTMPDSALAKTTVKFVRNKD